MSKIFQNSTFSNLSSLQYEQEQIFKNSIGEQEVQIKENALLRNKNREQWSKSIEKDKDSSLGRKQSDNHEEIDVIHFNKNGTAFNQKSANKQQVKIGFSKKGKNCQIHGGGCGASRSTEGQKPQRIVIKEKHVDLNEKFVEDYKIYTDKQRIEKNISQQKEPEMQNEIFKECISRYQIDIRRNVQLYKPFLLELIDVYLIYVLSGSSQEEGLEQDELKEIGQIILKMKQSFERDTQNFPSLDLVFYFDILHRFNSSRVGIDKQKKSNLIEAASFISKLVQIGASAFKGDFMDVVSIAASLGESLIESYQKHQSKQLYSYVLDIYIKRTQKFKENIWKVKQADDLEFYIQLFCDLSMKQDLDKDFILIILFKINCLFISAKEEDEFQLIRKVLPLNSDLIQKFLPKMIQQTNQQQLLQNKIEKSFFKFSVKNPIFRFLAVSILLKYNQILTQVSDFQNYKEQIIIYLIYKYLCEKDKSVKLAYETNKQFEEIYNKKIDNEEFVEKIKEISKKRQLEFSIVPDLTQLGNVEEQINNKEDIDRLVANNLIEKWERDVRKRQEQNAAQKDDVLLEVKDLYIQQSITYLQGNSTFSQKLPSRQSFSEIGDKTDIQTNLQQNALQIIKNIFLSCNSQQKSNDSQKDNLKVDEIKNELQNKCKILGILAEGGTGKSMLLKKIETDLIESSNSSQSSTQNSDYIPLIIKCVSLDPVKPSIEQYLLMQGVHENQVKTIKQSPRNKVILLDGFDEYTGEYFKVFNKLNLQSWRNTKVIVTTRREKLTLNEACANFSLDNENGQRDESSFCLVKLEEFNKRDIKDYCERYFKQFRNDNQEQIKKDFDCITDCMKNQQLESLLFLPINLYLFTRIIVDIENSQKIQEIKSNISDQVGIQDFFFQEQFKRETIDFVQQIEIFKKDQSKCSLITNCYFEYFQQAAMQMFLNKGKEGINNFLQLQKNQINFTLRSNVRKLLSEQQQKNLLDKIIISKEVNLNLESSQQNNKHEVIEFKHKSLFEYFVSRAMKYDFDIHDNQIYNLPIEELKKFSINQKIIMNIGQNQSEQQILLKLYKLIKNEIESKEFYSNYSDEKINNNNKYIQFLKRSSIQKSSQVSQIDSGASNLISAMFISKFSFPKLNLSLCSFSKAYICSPKSNEIKFDRCNLQFAYLKNSHINYDSCNTQSACFDAFSKIFDTRNVYTFNKLIWGKNNYLYTITETGFVNSFKFQNQEATLQNTKQLSQTPLCQIRFMSDDNLIVSSKFSLILINSNNFEIIITQAFKDPISDFSLIGENIIVNLVNETLHFGSFKNGFKQMEIHGQGSVYNSINKVLATYINDKLFLWNAEKNFELINTIQGHTNKIQSVAFSGDGKYLATGSEDQICKIWNTEKGFQLIHSIQGHKEGITYVAFSPDKKYLATGSEDKTCKIWNTEKDFELINSLQGHGLKICSVAFSEDGKYLATGSFDQSCKIWNAEKGFELIKNIQGHIRGMSSIAFSSNGKYLATGSPDETCKIWNAQKDFQLIHSILGHTGGILSVAFTTDGKYLATGSRDRTCKIWNVDKGFELIDTIKGHTDDITSVKFSGDGKYLATISQDQTCKIFNAEKGFELIHTIEDYEEGMLSFSFSPDGKYLAVGNLNANCKIWNIVKGFELINTLQGHTAGIPSIAFSANGKYLATGSFDQTCKIWNAEKNFQLIIKIQGHIQDISSIAFSADSKLLATGSSDITCKLWNAEKGFELVNTIQGHERSIYSVTFSADGKQLATISEDFTYKIWNVEIGFEHINQIQSHSEPITSLSFSLDGKYLATGSYDQICKIWNVEKGFELIHTIQGHTDKIFTVAFSADGKYLATGSEDRTCKIWNTEKGFELINTIQGHFQGISHIVFSVNGKYLLTGSYDESCKIWNAQKGFDLINTLQGHNLGAFSADGKYLATGTKDNKCKIWNAEKDFLLINTIQGHTEMINSIAFSVDGKYLATGSKDKTCKIWYAEKGFDLINTISGHINTIFQLDFSPDGKYLTTFSRDSYKIWNAEKGFELINTTQQVHAEQICSASFSADGKYLATGSFDKICKISSFSENLNKSIQQNNFTLFQNMYCL